MRLNEVALYLGTNLTKSPHMAKNPFCHRVLRQTIGSLAQAMSLSELSRAEMMHRRLRNGEVPDSEWSSGNRNVSTEWGELGT